MDHLDVLMKRLTEKLSDQTERNEERRGEKASQLGSLARHYARLDGFSLPIWEEKGRRREREWNFVPVPTLKWNESNVGWEKEENERNCFSFFSRHER